jgi:hypothetical protein
MKIIIRLFVLWVSVILTSCAIPHYYYSPDVQNVPLFKEKNEFSGLIAGSFGEVNNCLEVQAGYSFPGHVALVTNYMTGGNNHSTEHITDFSKIHYFEGACGYYKALKDNGVFEIYGGYGNGSESHAFTYVEYIDPLTWRKNQDGTADMSFSKLFIQPDVGLKIKWLEGAFSLRISNLNYSGININNTVYHLEELNNLKLNSNSWLIEPAITCRMGSKSVKGQVQLVFSRNLTNSALLFEKFRINFGLYFNFERKQSKTKTDLPSSVQIQ